MLKLLTEYFGIPDKPALPLLFISEILHYIRHLTPSAVMERRRRINDLSDPCGRIFP